MKVTYSNLMSSRFFNPAFNSAIFDGPIRLYFAQFHESLALKIYFSLQQNHPGTLAMAKEMQKENGFNALVMLYPSADAFQMSFEGCRDFVIEDQLDEDTIVGINGPFDDNKLSEVLSHIAVAVERAFMRFSQRLSELDGPEL